MVWAKTVSLLALVGAVFLSTIFHSAWFVLGWFINMGILALGIYGLDNVKEVFVMPVLGYVPLSLLYVMRPWINETYDPRNEWSVVTPFSVTLIITFIITFIISLLMLDGAAETKNKANA